MGIAILLVGIITKQLELRAMHAYIAGRGETDILPIETVDKR